MSTRARLYPEVAVTARIPALAVGCFAATLLTLSPADVLAQRRAVARSSAPHTRVVVRSYAPRYYYPYGYYPYGYYGGFYGSYGFGAWYSPFYYQPFPPPYYGRYWDDMRGSLRLQVTPRDAEVFIDGYFAGTVDDFDGVFQRLHVEQGDHEVELFHPQRTSVRQKVYLQPDKTFTVKLDMAPLAPGDPAPVRPAASQTSSTQDSSSQTPDTQDRRARDPQRSGMGQRPGPRTASEFGAVSLRVQPRDAEVLIDGERWDGSTSGDRLVVELAPGTHHVEVRKDGFRTYRTDLTVRRGETATLNVGLAAN
jgi:hypothetical protein